MKSLGSTRIWAFSVVNVLLAGLLASTAATASPTVSMSDPGVMSHYAYAYLVHDVSNNQIISKGSTAGWPQGTIEINTELWYRSAFSTNWQKLYDVWNTCRYSQSCSTPTYYHCAANPGTYNLKVYAYGPSTDRFDEAEVVVGYPSPQPHVHTDKKQAARMKVVNYLVPLSEGWQRRSVSSSYDNHGPTTITATFDGPNGPFTAVTYLRNTGVRAVARTDVDDAVWETHAEQQDVTLVDAAATALTQLAETQPSVDKAHLSELFHLAVNLGQAPWQATEIRIGEHTASAYRIDIAEGWVLVAIDPRTQAPVSLAGPSSTAVPDLTRTMLSHTERTSLFPRR